MRFVVAKYSGTRLGRQELDGEILDDNPGALWKRDQIETLRVTQHPPLIRIAVAIDPAVTANEGSDETGIIVGGVGEDGHGYILDDKSLRARPPEWARTAVTAYYMHKADRIFAEVNNGGDLVEATIRIIDPAIPYTAVHASRGKVTRAEPVAALYERGRVHHVGTFPDLEDQLCSWEQGMSSPDRLDALVWLLTELMVTRRGIPFADEIDATLMASARDAAQEHIAQEQVTAPAATPVADATPSTGVDPFAWADAHL
jgi:predicted phage terminase large subunit-like protein